MKATERSSLANIVMGRRTVKSDAYYVEKKKLGKNERSCDRMPMVFVSLHDKMECIFLMIGYIGGAHVHPIFSLPCHLAQTSAEDETCRGFFFLIHGNFNEWELNMAERSMIGICCCLSQCLL